MIKELRGLVEGNFSDLGSEASWNRIMELFDQLAAREKRMREVAEEIGNEPIDYCAISVVRAMERWRAKLLEGIEAE